MSDVITHLLGYLNAKQWADTLRDEGISKGEVYDLLQEQQDRYDGGIVQEVIDELYDRVGNNTPLRILVAKHFNISLCEKCGNELEKIDGEMICRNCNDS